MRMQKMVKTVEECIASYPSDVQAIMQKIRQIVKEVFPEASETIKYGIPTFVMNGKNVFHYAAYKHHIGIYPAGQASEDIPEAEKYRTGKGTYQFPLDKPIPYELIKQIAEYRLQWAHEH